MLRHFSMSVIYLRKEIYTNTILFTRNVHRLLQSTFAFVLASIQPILCIILDQYCPTPLQVVPTEPFSNKLIFKPAFSSKLTTTSLSRSSQDFFAAKPSTFSFNSTILSLTMFDVCHGARSSW